MYDELEALPPRRTPEEWVEIFAGARAISPEELEERRKKLELALNSGFMDEFDEFVAVKVREGDLIDLDKEKEN